MVVVASPEKIIVWETVDRLLRAGCTGSEVAAQFGIHPETLYNRIQIEKGIGFSAYAQEKRSHGDALIKAQQFEEALGISEKKGTTQLLLKLCEHRLGQKDGQSTDAAQARSFYSLFNKLQKIESALLSRGIKLSELEIESSLFDQDTRRKEDTV